MFSREGIIFLTCRDVDRSSHQGVVSAKWSKLAWPNPYADYHPLYGYAFRCEYPITRGIIMLLVLVERDFVGTRREGLCWAAGSIICPTSSDNDAKIYSVVVSPGSTNNIYLVSTWAACSQINIPLQI